MKANNADSLQESERELADGVLKQTAQDLRRFHGRTSRVERELFFDAHSWVMSDDNSWPFSFLNVCHILSREPEELRQELVGDLAFGPPDQWIRRCIRAIRRYRNSLTQRFATEHNLKPNMPAVLVQTSH